MKVSPLPHTHTKVVLVEDDNEFVAGFGIDSPDTITNSQLIREINIRNNSINSFLTFLVI